MDDDKTVQAEVPQPEVKEPVANQTPTTSNEHLAYYLQHMNKYSSSCLTLTKNQKVLRRRFREQLKLTIDYATINRQVVILRARWGYFSLNIKILNISQSNFKHGQMVAKGGFAFVFSKTFLAQNIILKCIEVNSVNSRFLALREWILLKMASLLKCGPLIHSPFGFDILMYNQCIEFPMEKCQPIDSEIADWNSLLQNLAVLHQFHLVHMDIKPENIMFSREFQKAVFIDFGLSELIKEKQGQKSVSNFSGSLIYCSKEMAKCVWQDNNLIDLYYNDLYCLEGSLTRLKNSIGSLIGILELISYQDQENNHNYSLYLMKFYLIKNQIDRFRSFWNGLGNKQKKRYRSEIFTFFLELAPTPQLKQLFFSFVESVDLQGWEYSKLKIVYETDSFRLNTINLLINQDKLNFFNDYVEDYYVQRYVDQKAIFNRKLEISNLLRSKDSIKRLSLIKYCLMYVGYISYTDNVFKIGRIERVEVASVFYSLLISSSTLHLKGTAILHSTIRYILEWLLDSSFSQEQAPAVSLLLLKTYDILLILDVDSVEEHLKYTETIFEHKILTPVLKTAFLVRINQSIQLNRYRTTRKGECSRTQFIIGLQKLVTQLNKKLILHPINQNSSEDQLSQIDSFQVVSLQQYVYELIVYNSIKQQKTDSYQNLLRFGDQISAGKKHPKFHLFYPQLFHHFYFQQHNQAICKQIYNIMKLNIKDEQLLEQFIFQFQINTAFKYCFSANSKWDQLIPINAYLIQIAPTDLLLSKDLILAIFNQLKIQFECAPLSSKDTLILQQNKEFLDRTVGALVEYYQQQLLSKKITHKCFKPIQILSLLTIAQVLEESAQLKVRQLCQDTAYRQGNCSVCSAIVLLNHNLHTLQVYLQNYLRKGLGSEYINQIEKSFFHIANQIKTTIQDMSPSEDLLLLLDICLNFRQLMCCSNRALQQKYRGVEDYYSFSIKQNRVGSYFKGDGRHSFPIFNTLLILHSKNMQELVNFLYLLSLYPESTLKIKDFDILVQVTGNFIGLLKQQQVEQLFNQIGRYQQSSKMMNGSLAFIYVVLHHFLKARTLKNRLVAVLCKMHHKIFCRFQRHLLIHISMDTCSEFGLQKVMGVKVPRRKEIFYSNKLLKLLVVEKETRVTLRKGGKSIFAVELMKKVACIPQYKDQTKNIRFLVK